MHRLDYMAPFPTRPRVPPWVFLAMLTLNIGVAVYCLTHDRHVFAAIGGVLVGGTLLWNLHRALNHDEISAVAAGGLCLPVLVLRSAIGFPSSFTPFSTCSALSFHHWPDIQTHDDAA